MHFDTNLDQILETHVLLVVVDNELHPPRDALRHAFMFFVDYYGHEVGVLEVTRIYSFVVEPERQPLSIGRVSMIDPFRIRIVGDRS